ncbi:MAG: phosphoenolpyruvate synthase [Syntrophobacteraceae bacterium]
MSMRFVLSAKESLLHDETLIGGKAKNLALMTCRSLPVPEWFVVTTEAYAKQIEAHIPADWIRERLNRISEYPNDSAALSEEIRNKISVTPLIDDIADAVRDEISRFADWNKGFYAVRSSAVGEDALAASFAGQMDSFLYRKGLDAVLTSILMVFAGAFTERAIRYRLNHGMNIHETRTAVIVQRMIESRVSGVFFTAHPVSGSRKHGLISACYGAGEGIVSGVCNTDEFTVELYGNSIESTINDKDCFLAFDAEAEQGTRKIDTGHELRLLPCLTEEELYRIRDLGRSIAESLHFPQDIEWAISDDTIYILQTRPITSLPPPLHPEGDTIIWDNSNIQESYCGVTTPLTFSFASRAYRSVYTQTYQVIGVPSKTLQQMEPVLKNLLGLVKGRVYYNINNWYRSLLILPSFKTNKADMERMMGLLDPEDFIEDRLLSPLQKLRKLPGLLKALYNFNSSFRKIDRLVAEFRSHFRRQYERVNRARLHTMEIAELLSLLEDLKVNCIGKWQTPIINDFYVMMMNGKVHRRLEKAGLENPAVVQNNLMSGEEGIESTEPTKFLLRMCNELSNKAELLQLVQETPNERLLTTLKVAGPQFYEKCLEYIELYGDRCMGELKLESITLRQDPSFMFAVLKNFLTRPDLSIDTLLLNEIKFRSEAEEKAFSAIESKLGKRALAAFKRDVAKLRQGVKNRENMRLARTRGFGLVRDIYLEIGKQLACYGILEDGRDIFFLTEEELESYMDGRSVQSNFKLLVAGRKSEYAAYENEELPHHFSTTGPVYHNNKYEYKPRRPIIESDNILKGIGCYPGIVEKRVKLILSPKDDLNLNGEILCTVRTDPGWAPLFPTAGGILVERGSTLSHSAVVARELGIPAIVNIPELTKIIKNGETVRMDGAKGLVERLDLPRGIVQSETD